MDLLFTTVGFKPVVSVGFQKKAVQLCLELGVPPLEEARACLLLVEALAGVGEPKRNWWAPWNMADEEIRWDMIFLVGHVEHTIHFFWGHIWKYMSIICSWAIFHTSFLFLWQYETKCILTTFKTTIFGDELVAPRKTEKNELKFLFQRCFFVTICNKDDLFVSWWLLQWNRRGEESPSRDQGGWGMPQSPEEGPASSCDCDQNIFLQHLQLIKRFCGQITIIFITSFSEKTIIIKYELLSVSGWQTFCFGPSGS